MRWWAGLVLGSALALPRPAVAQMAESIASVSADYTPSTRGPQPGQRVGTSVLRATMGYPLVLKGGWVLLPSVSYERLAFRSDGLAIAPRTLHAPMASFGVLKVFTPKLMGLVSVSGGFASDFERPVAADELVVTGMVLAMYRFNDNLMIGAGVGYDRRTGNVQPLPALPVKWRPSSRFQLRGVVPAFLSAEYRTAPWLTTALRGSFEGNRYHLGAPRYGTDDLQLAYSVIGVGPRLTFHLGKLLHLDVYGNVPVLRRYATYVDDDKTSSSYLKPVFTFGTRLWVGPDPWARK